MEVHTSVQLDLPAAWPRPVKAFVAEVAGSLAEPLGHWPGGGILDERESAFREAFEGAAVRAFHATRLLPHEIEAIRDSGLRMLTEDLVLSRIREAATAGFLDAHLVKELESGHVFATREFENRENQICFFLSTSVLEHRPGSVRNLMRYWGGEALSFSKRSSVFEQHLERLGVPAVVIADLDLTASPNEIHRVWPGLLRAFAGRYVGERLAGASVHYGHDVDASRIADVWTPGHPRYDQFKELPR